MKPRQRPEKRNKNVACKKSMLSEEYKSYAVNGHQLPHLPHGRHHRSADPIGKVMQRMLESPEREDA
jgi:hypothetical protein